MKLFYSNVFDRQLVNVQLIISDIFVTSLLKEVGYWCLYRSICSFSDRFLQLLC